MKFDYIFVDEKVFILEFGVNIGQKEAGADRVS